MPLCKPWDELASVILTLFSLFCLMTAMMILLEFVSVCLNLLCYGTLLQLSNFKKKKVACRSRLMNQKCFISQLYFVPPLDNTTSRSRLKQTSVLAVLLGSHLQYLIMILNVFLSLRPHLVSWFCKNLEYKTKKIPLKKEITFFTVFKVYQKGNWTHLKWCLVVFWPRYWLLTSLSPLWCL